MKISQPLDNPVAVSNNSVAQAAKNGTMASTLVKTGAPKSAASAGVAVSVSDLTRSLESASLGETSEVDTAKVSFVRNAIAQGTFAVNPEAIADKMLSNVMETLQGNGS